MIITVIPPKSVKLYLQSSYKYQLDSGVFDCHIGYDILNKHDWIHYRIFNPKIIYEIDFALILKACNNSTNFYNSSYYNIYSSTGALRCLYRYDIKAYLSRKLYYKKKKMLNQMILYIDMIGITNLILKKKTNTNIVWK
jgi:hypothetical protein